MSKPTMPLPCPFCGGVAGYASMAPDPPRQWFIYCGDCGASSKMVPDERQPDDENSEQNLAAKRWNKRT